jgi:hypothetical protein
MQKKKIRRTGELRGEREAYNIKEFPFLHFSNFPLSPEKL